mmetsp:Transcript_614/g.1066  ORF Transcript_614/g.1066 Transcript_614/m.1066 type:complete len:534 (+) Transcript_614:28-1629(+)
MLKLFKNRPTKSFSQQNFLSSATQKQQLSQINFQNYEVSFKSKSTSTLLRGLFVFSACKVQLLVNNSEKLLKLSSRVFGEKVTSFVLKKSFFGHFCAGEDELSIKPTIKQLENAGVGSILDYAAESDLSSDEAVVKDVAVKNIQCRVYDYKNEDLCDFHTTIFAKCIRAVKAVSPTGFAAIKCTALGNPELLKRVSTTLLEIKNLFIKLDPSNSGFVHKDDFLKTFSTLVDGKNALSYFDGLDADKDDKINYIEWTNGLDILQLHLLTAHCTTKGPLFASQLNEEERILFTKMKQRLFSLASLAQSQGVRLMIDAEQSYFQPAIDNLTTTLFKQFNSVHKDPVIFSTYQMYLKDTKHRLDVDLDRALNGNYKFAAKLVRGAYMDLERSIGMETGLGDPVNESIEITHRAYNDAVYKLIRFIAQGRPIEVMIASHNQQSVEYALQAMQEYQLDPQSSPIYFGQLLGMSDHLTYSLGAYGYKAYKYVPYGKVSEVMPYLIRRAQENSSALSGADNEIAMILLELKRRLRRLFFSS